MAILLKYLIKPNNYFLIITFIAISLFLGVFTFSNNCLAQSVGNKQVSYPPPNIDKAGVVAFKNPDGSQKTLLYAYISGPSPIDVTSFTVNGPSGSYDLVPSIETHTDGLVYGNSKDINKVLPDGEYEFVLTDSQGRKDTLIKDFSYKSVQGINSSTMRPNNKSYVDTTTPTLTFDPISNPDAYYMIYVMDMYGKAIHYRTEVSQQNSFTIPKGMLQPGSPYIWFVRVYDKYDPQNGVQSEAKMFFTGSKGLPDLNFREVIAFSGPDPDFLVRFFSVKQPKLAPWDIEYIKVTDPEERTYNLDRMSLAFDETARYDYFEPVDSMPKGTYTFEVEDVDGHQKTKSLEFTQEKMPSIDEDSIQPKNNTYFSTKRPTFSWDPVEGDSQYYYLIEIRDFLTKIQWFQSQPMVKTSFTLPKDAGLIPGNSYMWSVFVSDGETPLSLNNLAISSYRVFSLASNPQKAMPWLPLLLSD